MKAYLALLFFLSIANATYSQLADRSVWEDSLTSVSLDSVINHIRPEKTKLIAVRQGKVNVDSTSFRKAAYTIDKKEVKITAKDYTYKTVPSNEFWGLVNDFGQCQRFYKGQKYIVWYPKAPYIYREYESSGHKINYFYSESLVSAVIPITEENIKNIADPQTMDLLTAYLKTHNIKKSKDGGPSLPLANAISDGNDENSDLMDLLLLHLEILETILTAIAK